MFIIVLALDELMILSVDEAASLVHWVTADVVIQYHILTC